MKQRKIKPRAHRALFCRDTPFKPKVVERKDIYKRKPKHRAVDLD